MFENPVWHESTGENSVIVNVARARFRVGT